MDPDACLNEALTIARRIIKTVDRGEAIGTVLEDDASSLAERIINLHEWITRGGFHPKAWSK